MGSEPIDCDRTGPATVQLVRRHTTKAGPIASQSDAGTIHTGAAIRQMGVPDPTINSVVAI